MRPSLKNANRIVVKIGTNLLAGGGQGFRSDFAAHVAEQTAKLRLAGKEILLVSSGAIGLGAHRLGLKGRIEKITQRQICAAVGQPLLMAEYDRMFRACDVPIAQVLLTRDLLNDRESFLNIQATINNLLQEHIVPVCNENDSVSVAEIGPVFGDNDNLSAHIASKLNADLLILLTDIDALYTADPGKNPEAKPISLIEKVTKDIFQLAGGSNSIFGTGGMKTKLEAVQIAARAGTQVVIADGNTPDVLLRLLDDEELGTLFLPGERMKSRLRWIANAAPKGRIQVDDGALRALHAGKSLLPSGIVTVHGTFHCGDIISINGEFHAICRLDSEKIQQIKGLHSSSIRSILGAGAGSDVVAQADDIIALNKMESLS
ncbi:glutamate 5-kinase [Spirochaeta dissipatitropha]